MFSACILFLFFALPLWNSALLLSSVLYTHFLGSGPMIALIASCCSVFFGYVILLKGFFQSLPYKARSAQTVAMLAGAVLTALGLSFMLCGHSLSDRALLSAHQVLADCAFAEPSAELARTSALLYVLRSSPLCAARSSVELCTGYVATPESAVLKVMESDLHCSTFCHKPQVTGAAASALFSPVHLGAPCQAAVARVLEHFVADLGAQTYYQGCMLVLIAVVMSLTKIMGSCSPMPSRPKVLAPDYGATSYGHMG